jgi:4-cresol dehydrogenase (hydroxylating)
MKLPPGVSAEQFQAAVQRMQAVVGTDWVLTDDADIWTYRDSYTPFYGDQVAEYIPSGAVAPTEVAQVQQIVRIANEFRIPLWPISTGRNLGYGGSAPRMSGTMVLDLKRMNKVLAVDEHRCYALVEPGVSYLDFYKYLRDHKLKVWLDCADPGWGSLIGNALDHGVGHGPNRDHFASICGLEVVLPNGELMRTGSGALPGSKAWQTFPYGYGPHIAPMFGQSNFGIVTKAGFYLIPEPEVARSYHIMVPRHDDIHPFLDQMAAMVCDGTLNQSWQIDSPLLGSRDPKIAAAVERADGGSSSELDQMSRDLNIPYWGTRIYLHGSSKVVDAKWQDVQSRLSNLEGVKFKSGNAYHFPDDYDKVKDGDDGDVFAQTACGIPTMSIYGMGIGGSNLPTRGPRARLPHGIGFFSPIVSMSGEDWLGVQKVVRQTERELGMPLSRSAGGWAWFRCTLVLLYVQPIVDDPEKNLRMMDNVRALAKACARHGYSEYRTHTVWMDDVMSAFSFNDNALLRFHETIKDAVDPNGILAPGRNGIWPKNLRGKKI